MERVLSSCGLLCGGWEHWKVGQQEWWVSWESRKDRGGWVADLPSAVLPLVAQPCRLWGRPAWSLGSACQCRGAVSWGTGWGQSWSCNPWLEGLPVRRACDGRLCGGLRAGTEGVKRSSAAGGEPTSGCWAPFPRLFLSDRGWGRDRSWNK